MPCPGLSNVDSGPFTNGPCQKSGSGVTLSRYSWERDLGGGAWLGLRKSANAQVQQHVIVLPAAAGKLTNVDVIGGPGGEI